MRMRRGNQVLKKYVGYLLIGIKVVSLSIANVKKVRRYLKKSHCLFTDKYCKVSVKYFFLMEALKEKKI